MTSPRSKCSSRFVPPAFRQALLVSLSLRARPTLLVFLALAAVLSVIPTDRAGAVVRKSGAKPRGSALAYTPQAIWSGGGIVDRLGITPGAIYLVDRSTEKPGKGKIVGSVKRHWAYDAKLSPSGDLVAFHGRRLESKGGVAEEGIGVLDLNGTVLTFVPRAVTFAWNPTGTKLAMTVLPMGLYERTVRPKLIVWSRQGRSTWSLGALPSRVGWARGDSLLLQLGNDVVVFDRRKGRSKLTGHHGTIVSPDGLYSMWPGQGGANTRVIEDETNQDVTRRLFGYMQDQGLHEIRSAFWVLGPGADHYMCVSGSDHLYAGNPRCKTAIIDARTGDPIAEFPGEALGPTGDGTKAVVLHHEADRFETVDLERIVRERGARERGEGSVWY